MSVYPFRLSSNRWMSTSLNHCILLAILCCVNACGGGSSGDSTPTVPDPTNPDPSDLGMDDTDRENDPVVIGDSTINTATARIEPNRLSILPNGSSQPLIVTFPGDEATWPKNLTYRWLADGPLNIENIPDSNSTAENSAVIKTDDITADTPVTGMLSVAVYSADSAQIGYATSELIVERQLTVKPAKLQILRYDVPNSETVTGTTSHACAIIPVSTEVGALSYRLRGVGGNDEAFYGETISLTPKTADSFCNLNEEAYPNGFFFLSANSGPTTSTTFIQDIDERIQGLAERFGDFIFTIEVGY